MMLDNVFTDDDDYTNTGKKFSADYCKRGSTKCKTCKKRIQKGELRIEKSVPFKAIHILQYYHLKCAFNSFKNGRLAANVITCMDDINVFNLLIDSDKRMILEAMDDANAKRTKTLNDEPKKKVKKAILIQDTPKGRLKRLKSSSLPSIKVICTNADQLTSSKKDELLKMIEKEHPLIVAVCEVKPKNAKDRSLKDYEIPNFELHPVNLDTTDGRGIAVYTHESIDKSTIQVIPNLGFQEVCLLEIRLHGGDLLLFGLCYRSPTLNNTSAVNNNNLNKLFNYLSLKKYSHVCVVGDFNFKSIN